MATDILFISPRRNDAVALAAVLRPLEINLRHATGLPEARMQVAANSYPVILTEARLVDASWIDVLQLASAQPDEPLVIVTDRAADERLWAEVLNLGAYDLLAQPFDANEIRRVISSACLHAGQPASAEPKSNGLYEAAYIAQECR